MAMLAYAELGSSGEPIVFLPGITCDKDHWRPVAERLAEDHRCVLVDPPGHGDSPLGSMNLLAQGQAVREVVDALDLGAPFVVGHSAGGITATVYAILHPCRGVVSIEGTLDLTGPFGSSVYRNRELLLDPERFEEGFADVIAPMRIDLVPQERRDWAASLIGRTPEVVLDAWSGVIAGQGAELTEQLATALPAITAPVLVLWGEPAPEGERRMIGLIPNGSVEEWLGVGHFLPQVDPDRVADRVRAFVQAHSL
jgi:pimeloyl-ACP methyl ester carboxylesterase